MDEFEKNARELLEENGVILDGHFVGTSGKHMSKYVNKDNITRNPELTNKLATMLAQKAGNLGIELAISPTMGAVVFGHVAAYHMDIPISVFCEKDEKAKHGFVFKRGYASELPGKRSAVFEDILNTGGSALDTINAAIENGAKVEVLCAILNRQAMNAEDFGVDKLITLITGKPGEFDLYEADDCPLCKAGVPVNTEVGHGAKFIEEKKNSSN